MSISQGQFKVIGCHIVRINLCHHHNLNLFPPSNMSLQKLYCFKNNKSKIIALKNNNKNIILLKGNNNNNQRIKTIYFDL